MREGTDIIGDMHTQNNRELWQNILTEIELTIPGPHFKTWFKDTSIVKIEDGVATIGVPTEVAREWLQKKHSKLLLKSLRSHLDSARSLEFVVYKSNKLKQQAPTTRSPFFAQELPLGEHYVNRSDNLNPKYVFETFVVGPFNEIAFSAAQGVVKEPGITYNPLFIYGNTGYGKTHLIQAIGNQIKKQNPSRKVFYVTSEKFTMDFVNALQSNSVNAFKEKYRQYDVLIMDDIQFFAQKEKTQEELFHLFNSLYQNNKQIIFSCDKHPNYIQDLEDRLKSRFAQGMIIDISEPDSESRIAILKTKAAQHNFHIEDSMLTFIASLVDGNIRDLEGMLNAVICQTQLRGRPLNPGEIKHLIKDSSRPKRAISPKEIVKRVAEFYDLEENAIYEKTRKKEVVRPRQLIMYILREDYNVSYPLIGEKLGGRDHTTVIHSCEKIKKDIQHNSVLQQELQHIRMMLK